MRAGGGGGAGDSSLYDQGSYAWTTEGIKHMRIFIESRFVEIRGHSKKGNKRD